MFLEGLKELAKNKNKLAQEAKWVRHLILKNNFKQLFPFFLRRLGCSYFLPLPELVLLIHVFLDCFPF